MASQPSLLRYLSFTPPSVRVVSFPFALPQPFGELRVTLSPLFEASPLARPVLGALGLAPSRQLHALRSLQPPTLTLRDLLGPSLLGVLFLPGNELLPRGELCRILRVGRHQEIVTTARPVAPVFVDAFAVLLTPFPFLFSVESHWKNPERQKVSPRES